MNITIEKLNGDYSTKLNQKVKINLLDFAEMIGAEIEVRERDLKTALPNAERYYVHFKECHVKEKTGAYSGISGDGKTINQALSDYAKRISGQLLVFNAWSGCNRWEIKAPKLVYMPNKKVKKMFSDYSKA